MSDPLISICTPACKAELYLEATLDSICAQTFGDWELIVVEDGSHVRGEILPECIAYGIPARAHRHDIRWKRERPPP